MKYNATMPMPMIPSPVSDRVLIENGRHYTKSLVPGVRTYGERVVESDGIEYREWNPHRSKISAFLANGGRSFPFKIDSRILYLGASSGTTPSHLSDIAAEGMVYCVEFSQRMFRDLLRNCNPRRNMTPVLADATNPLEYSFLVDSVDVVYCDVAQKRQVDILCDNMEAFNVRRGMISIKARSEDVSANPSTVFERSESRFIERGLKVMERIGLGPFEDSHEVMYVEV